MALGLDAGQLEGLAHHLGQFLDAELGFQDVLAGVLPGLVPLAGFTLTITLANTLTTRVMDKVGKLQVGHGDADDVFAFAAEQLVMAEVAF